MSDWQYENLPSWTIKWNVSDQETHCRGIVTINYLFISIFRTLSLTYCALLSLASTTLAHYSLRSQTRLSQPPIDWSLLLVNINTPQLKVAACSTWPARNSPVSVKCITWRKYCSFFSLHKNQCEKVREKKKTKVIAMKNWECECVSPYDLGIFAVGPTNGHRAHVERWISVQLLFFVCEIKFVRTLYRIWTTWMMYSFSERGRISISVFDIFACVYFTVAATASRSEKKVRKLVIVVRRKCFSLFAHVQSQIDRGRAQTIIFSFPLEKTNASCHVRCGSCQIWMQ